VIELELSRGEAMALFIGDRGRFGPRACWTGGKCEVTLYRQGKKVYYIPPHLTKDERVFLRGRVSIQKGDVVLQLKTPGSGGYGNPLARAPDLVLRDVLRGDISRRSAEQDYAVIIRGRQVD
jgi:N-methylhydantoinase B